MSNIEVKEAKAGAVATLIPETSPGCRSPDKFV